MPSLASALTFHASFDNGTDADVGRGDRAIYTVGEGGALTAGLGEVAIARGAGRFGDALQFTLERTNIVAYQVEGNVAYSDAAFRGTVSFWMRVDPGDIPGQYCDPIQVTDKDYADSCIWLDFTKNDAPSDMRLGIFGNRAEGTPGPSAATARSSTGGCARSPSRPSAATAGPMSRSRGMGSIAPRLVGGGSTSTASIRAPRARSGSGLAGSPRRRAFGWGSGSSWG